MGIPTVTLNLIPQVASIVGIPRALYVKHPFGSPVGTPNDATQQLQLLRTALEMLATAKSPGVVRHLDTERE